MHYQATKNHKIIEFPKPTPLSIRTRPNLQDHCNILHPWCTSMNLTEYGWTEAWSFHKILEGCPGYFPYKKANNLVINLQMKTSISALPINSIEQKGKKTPFLWVHFSSVLLLLKCTQGRRIPIHQFIWNLSFAGFRSLKQFFVTHY